MQGSSTRGNDAGGRSVELYNLRITVNRHTESEFLMAALFEMVAGSRRSIFYAE